MDLRIGRWLETGRQSESYINIMYNVQDYIVLYNAVWSDIYEGGHFTPTSKTFAWPHHFSKRGCLGACQVLLKCLYKARKENSHIFVFQGYQFCLLSTIVVLDFRIVLTLWYFFVFHFVSFIEPLFFYSLGFFFIITFCIFFLNVTM
jgi:hypothetical protein